MKSIGYAVARENLPSVINGVCGDDAPLIIRGNRGQAVVMIALDEYESLQETANLLRSPANARRILKSINSLERGKVIREKSTWACDSHLLAGGSVRSRISTGSRRS